MGNLQKQIPSRTYDDLPQKKNQYTIDIFKSPLTDRTELQCVLCACAVARCGVVCRAVARCGLALCAVACVLWRGVLWRGVLWRGVLWRGVLWRGVVWRGVVWRGVVWHGASFVCTNKQSIKEGEGLICLFFHGKNNLVRLKSGITDCPLGHR
ncbi:hypothetical protein M513_04736 [Trichuris suis]|uniref:Uncharacterized protein n=1 Tax=Trichuris suis TaxID=68888 RepID=A0A085MAZ7_9BILA|nr:hypothetical protein M513_04736 [Trichuris suis]